MPEEQENAHASTARELRAARRGLASTFVRFNLKVLVMGLLDLFLVPASVLALVLGLTAARAEPMRYFRELMQFGRRCEHWINLFGDEREGGLDRVLGGYEQRIEQGIAARGRGTYAPPDVPDHDSTGSAAPRLSASASEHPLPPRGPPPPPA